MWKKYFIFIFCHLRPVYFLLPAASISYILGDNNKKWKYSWPIHPWTNTNIYDITIYKRSLIPSEFRSDDVMLRMTEWDKAYSECQAEAFRHRKSFVISFPTLKDKNVLIISSWLSSSIFVQNWIKILDFSDLRFISQLSV